MKKLSKIFSLLLMVAALALTVACGNDDETASTSRHKVTTPDRVILMYYPWSGESQALTSYFWSNISSMKTAYDANGQNSDRIVVFIATSGSEGYIFDLDDYQGNGDATLATYQKVGSPQFTTSDGILAIFNAMRAVVAAPRYSLIIGCHGQGWIPTAVNATASKVKGEGATAFRPSWTYAEGDGLPLTRLFGGTSAKYQTDISTLAEAISRMGVKMDYILFDDCYMASVEVAYDLRAVADYLVACPTEVMGDGILGADVGQYLLGTPRYGEVCEAFRSHYVSGRYPYGTISAIKCGEVDSLARVMKRVNASYAYDKSLNDSIQRMDGYLPTIFFDMGDYVAHLCKDTALLSEFEAQLARTVPYKAHTGNYPTTITQSGNSLEYTYKSGLYVIPIHTYSGLTIGEPTKYAGLTPLYPGLAWYGATH